MRGGLFLALLAAPAVAGVGAGVVVGDDMQALLTGEKNLTEVAEEIARREFTPHAQLIVVKDETAESRRGAWGETIRPDWGHVFHLVRVRMVNDGGVDVSVAAWEFVAEDDTGTHHSARTGFEHQDFDASRLPPGAAREGTVVFELPKDARLRAVEWRGAFASARGETAPA